MKDAIIPTIITAVILGILLIFWRLLERRLSLNWHAPTKDTTCYVRVKDSLASGAGGR